MVAPLNSRLAPAPTPLGTLSFSNQTWVELVSAVSSHVRVTSARPEALVVTSIGGSTRAASLEYMMDMVSSSGAAVSSWAKMVTVVVLLVALHATLVTSVTCTKCQSLGSSL